MAELYAKPYEVIDTGYNPQQTQQGGQDAEMQSYLESLPPEERQKAIERLNAPLTGEELALMAKSGQRKPTLEEFAEIEKFHKSHEVSFLEGLGKIAEGGEQVMTDLSNAFASFLDKPADATSKMPATAVEAFAQGTRNFYGMLAQSQNTDSVLFRVKDFLNGTGTLEDRYNQYIDALEFNKQSADLVEGKQTLVMDKDMINHEVTQAMAYIADPTLFIPFGKVASTGLRAVGLGEKLTMAGARAAAIKNGIIGNTIKWGVGQPLEFMGGAVRNTIDYGLEKAGAAFEATTGISGKEFAQTARMSGVGFSASGIAGYAVPYASTVSDAYLVGSSAKGFGEALTLIGDTMKKNKFGRGINSWAAEALEQAEKNGVALSPHAKGLLKTLNAVDPLFAYGWNGLETAAEGAFIGGTLGYLSDNAEGMYSGIGAGIALGAVGGTAGKVVADITGGTNVARRAVQAKMVIEGHKATNPEKAMFFQAMQKAAEIRGQDVDLVNGIIAGIDNVAPNFEFHALTPDQFQIEALKRGYNPDTGKFVELSAIDAEFGGDRASRSKAMSILRSIGGEFAGDRKAFLDALKKASSKDSADPTKPASNIPLSFRKYIDVAKSFEKLTKTQQEAILKEIDGQGSLAKELGGNTKLRDHYATLTWAEAWTDQLVKKFESDREGARKDITEMLSQETDKNGKLTRKGLALADKLRAEGFLDRDNKLLRERNLLNADLTYSNFKNSKGAVIERQADGKTHMYINLATMGSETFPHELFHTIMRESPMKKHFTDTLVHKLLGTVDKDGNLVRPAEVNIGQIEKFFKKYIDLTHRNDDGTLNAQEADAKFRQVQDALTEYRNAGENKKISDDARSLLENYTEEFGAYYFSHWLMGRNRNTLFFGGELKGVEGLVERAKDSFKDFWQSKISKSNPEFDFSRGLNEAFDRSKGLGRIGAMDYFMRDMVRAASNANKEVFRPDSMTLDNLRDFERSNGLRNLTAQGGTRRLNPREQVTQNIRLGKEAYKILSGLDKNLRTSKDVLDENGKQIITGRLSEAELDALVKGGIVPRAWADKVNQGYAMLDGTVSNIFSAGYFGRTEQITDASYPRLTGKDVSFKNRKAVLFDVETKIKADGTFYTLFHTLDLAVIEQRANHLWQNVDYRNLWNGDRAAFEADFFRYISNASKASTDPKKLDSAALLETGDGNGAKRRDVMHQMAGMALQTGDAYKHQPIAVIPEGIRHSVTTFNIDGMTMPRVETGTRYDINMGNAHKFIRENWQPAEMKQEKTTSGTLFTHETGFKFSAINGKYSAYANDGSKIGTYGTIKEATFAAKNLYNKAQENITKIANDFKQKEEQNRKNLQPLDEATYEEAFRVGDIFKTKRMQEIIGNSKLVRQTFDEFLSQKVEEINSGKNEQEKGAILQQLFNSEFKELIDLEAELKKTYDEFGLEERQLQEQETEITKRIVEFSQEKKRLQESGNPEAKIDIGILEMYGRIYKRKQEVNKRLSEIANKMHNEGITDLNSHYYITKRFLQNFNETGKLSEEAIKFAITPKLIKAYEANFETGKAVTFLANHGTPNHELMVSKTFDMGFLGRNTGSMSAFNATFFAGSKETSVNYVGNPIEMSWVKNFIDARSFYVKNLPIDVRVKIERLLQSDTSKGVVQKTSQLQKNLHEVFPDDFKLSDTARLNKDGEPVYSPYPKTNQGEYIYNLVDRILEGANDEGWAIGGYEMYWKEAGRNPYLLRNIVKMDNPYVHEYAKADYRDETFASVIRRAKEAGHDGVIFKNTKDGGGLDTIFASFAKNEDNKIFTLETTEDTRFAPRGTDESGNKVKGGSEIEGRNYQPTELPLERGKSEIKEGYTRVYHQTNLENIDSIKKHGLLVSKTRPTSESRGVSVSETPFYGNNPDLVTIELQVPTEKLKQANGSALLEDVPASNIIAVHEDWHDKARYILNNPSSLKEVLNGDMDFFLGDGSPEAKAIEYIKNKYKNNRVNLQPAEDIYSGGREYDFNSKQFKSGFVGLYAAENPDRVKGISLQFMKRKDGSHRIRLTDNSKKGESADIGHITANIDKDVATLSTHINEDYRGRKLAYVVYSEMAERLRAMGVTAVDGTIVNPDGVPIKVREKIIGDTRDLYSGRRINYVEGANRIRDKQEMVGSAGGIDVTNTLYKQARYQPDDYQGGDDYYKPRSNPFERKDEQGFLIREPYIRKPARTASGEKFEMNPDNVTWEEIGHFKRLSEKETGLSANELYRWENNDVGLWAFNTNTDAVVTKNKINPREVGFRYTHGEWFDEPFWSNNYTTIWGRYEKPIYDKSGNLVRRGRISMTGQYRGSIKDMAHAKKIKNDIAKKVKVSAEDIDAYIFDASEPIKQSMGFSSKDQLPIKFQPEDEGRVPDIDFDALIREEKERQKNAYRGKQYTPEQMTFSFIGRYASERPDFIKGLDLMYSGSGTARSLVLSDSNTGERIGHINLIADPESPNKHAYIQMSDVVQQGRGYGTLLYSELAERLRSEGYTSIDGRVVDSLGRPIKIRASVIDEVNKELGGKMTSVSGERVSSPLYPDAYYQPDEGRKYNKGQMDNQFIGRQAAERRDLIDGIRLAYRPWDKADGKDEGRKKIILTRSADGAEIGRIDFDYEHLTKYGLKSRGFGENEDGGIVVDGINVKVREGFQGKGYQHILYSEMFERARALGAVGFSQSIENKKGLPLKSVNRVIGEADNFIASLSEPDPQRPTQENFDRLMAGAPTPTGYWTSNEPAVQNWGKLNKKAWYQPDEKIGTQSSNVKLLLEGMASGRILRTSSYKGLGLEDSLLIAHTPDTAKIGRVTAGDKALADLQGGIFYAIANGNRIWASNFAGEGETNILVKFANRALKKNEGNKTYIMLVKADNSKIFASVDGARGVSSIFKHLNDSGVMSDLKYVKALKDSAKKHLNLTGLDGLGKDELFSKIDDSILNSEANKISFERRAKFSRSIATLLKDSGAFDSERSKKALAESFNSGFERGFSKKEMERVFGNLMAEDIIKDVPIGHVYGAIEIVSPLAETKESNHRGYNASIVQESGEPARLIMFDKTAHATEVLNKKSGERILKKDPTRHLKDSEGNYVHETDETGELVLTKKGKPKRIVEYKGEGSYISYTGGNIPYQEVRGKKKMPFQPSEYSDFKTEQSPSGRIMRNTKGYVITMANNKFRVYNPAKAILGVYGSEEEAKKRIYREIPKQ